MKSIVKVQLGMFSALSVAACAESTPRTYTPWGDDHQTHVIAPDGKVESYTIGDGDGCLPLDTVTCVKPPAACDAASELVLNEEDEVIAAICYPKGETLSVEQVEAQDGDVRQNQNGAVIALDDLNDGVDVQGDLSVDANNVVIYGEDPAHAVIAGDVSVDGNNIVVRGVTIQGDVEVLANNAVFLHCVIRGSIVVRGNNSTIAACDVFGNVELRGNNSELAGNHIVGALRDDGKNSVCTDNRAAADEDEDGVLSDSELGAPLSCAG